MKFADMYPDIKPIHDQRDSKESSVILGTTSHPCHWCKQSTLFVEINYEGPFCSEECIRDFENSIPGLT